MATTSVTYTGDGSTRNFAVPFAFIQKDDVYVYKNAIRLFTPLQYNWQDSATIRFGEAPGVGDGIVIRRVTEGDTRLVNFTNGAVLTEADLNKAIKQVFFLAQESKESYQDLINNEILRIAGSLGIVETDPDSLIAAIVATMLDSASAAELQQRITDIDTNAQNVIDVADRMVTVEAIADGFLDDLESVETAITTETASRVSGDEAIATSLALIGAKSSDSLAWILDTDTVKVDADTTFAQRLSAIDAIGTANAAAVVTEQTARTSADSALADDITAVSTTVAGHTATIATQATSIDGLEARYGVSLNVNGYITGFAQHNDGDSGSFSILADKFLIVDPASGGQDPTAVFAVEDGLVVMQNCVIGNALIEDLTVSKLTAGDLNANMNIGTGKIIWDNGSFMKVVGVGFGSSNQFLEWFGPTKSNTNLCTESNAIQYLKTNGDAYFRGTMALGDITNTGQSTNTAATAEVEVGPFGSNGGQISVAYSYSYQRNAVFEGDVTGQSISDCSATVRLRRKVGSGSYATIATKNISGDYHAIYVAVGDQTTWSQTMSGSFTYTDNLESEEDRTYLWEITARDADEPTGSLTSANINVRDQNLTVVCEE